MKAFDDDRYLEWYREMHALIAEFLDTEGNSIQALHTEIESAIEQCDEQPR